MVGWGLLLFSVWGYTKLISRPVWQGMRMWFNCSWLKVLLPRPTSGESSGWPPPCIIFFGVSSIATKALLIEETQEIWSFINFDVSSGLQVSRVERHFETSCVLSGEIQWSHDIPWIDFCYHVPIIFVIDISQRDVASGHPRSTIYTVAPPGRMVNGWQVGNPNSSFHCWILVRSDRFHVEIQLVTKGSVTMEPSSVAM